MPDRVYAKQRLVGCSPDSIEAAIQLAVGKSAAPAYWFEVVEIRGAVKDGVVSEWQVTLDLGQKHEG